MGNSITKDNYTLQLKEDILITTLKGVIKMDVVLKLFSDMRTLAIDNNGQINKLISDARLIEALLTMPHDYNVLPQLSKGLEEQNIISENAKNALIVGHEDHHLAAELLGLTFQKFGISHELKPFKSLQEASAWLGFEVDEHIPKEVKLKRRASEFSYLSQVGGSPSR